MLLFLDDSYERLPNGYRHVLAGFTIPEEGYRVFVKGVLAVKERYFLQDRNMAPEQRAAAWETHFVVGDEPANVELKASLLLSTSVLRNAGPKRRAARRIASEVLTLLRERGGRVVSAASQPPTIRHGVVTPNLLRLLESVSQSDDLVHVVLDTSNPNADQRLARRFAETVLSDERLSRISPTPFILDTRTSIPLQVADLIAHLTLQRLRPDGERKPLEELYDLIA